MTGADGRVWGTTMRKLILSAVAGGLMAAAMPAGADVKAGVDAWSKGDFPKAVAEWRPLAIAGDADAQFNLAQAYKLGRGVPLDPALAESWFRKAAVQGHLQAEDNYGLALFQSGKKAEARPWLEKSVARGEPRTQLVLGTMLFNGDGVARDYPRAYALMTRASESGLQSASQTLAQMDQYISPADREKGTMLARQYAAQTSMAPAPTGTRPGRTVPNDRPASASRPQVAQTPTAQAPAVQTPPPRTPVRTPPARTEPVRPTHVAKPVAVAKPVPTKPAPKPTASGNWRIQLGAFGTPGSAEGLWNRVRGKLGGAQPYYVKAGTVTRLQAGGFASKAAAAKACAASGQSCVVVAP
ncbi:SPOR domain-containing protein [Sphingomonas sp. R86521]|uniref:SPOR domain-containing protein n=1 Tax=Sphingomonas sp. R86521 TaxID=3093860 RepID=UPI0036D43401